MEADKFYDGKIDLSEEDIFDLVPQGPSKFESAEHDALAAACTLRWPNGKTSTGGDENFPVKAVPLQQKNYIGKTLNLTFNKVVPLSGDFFTTYDYLPISYGTPRTVPEVEEKDQDLKSPKATMKGRFQQALTMMAEDTLKTLGPCVDLLNTDVHLVGAIQHEHKHESQVYAGFDKADGGKQFAGNMAWMWAMSGDTTTGLIPELHYATSLLFNMDHFGTWAMDTYTIGHSIALDWAEKGQERKPDGTVRSACERLNALQEAYFTEAFAAHYLTDLFSAGHLRAPRRELHVDRRVKTGAATIISKIPGVSDVAYAAFGVSGETWDMQVNRCHNCDGASGLLVENVKGDRWVAYGDKQFFSPVNRPNRQRSIASTQAGIDEIYNVWSGKKSKPPVVFVRDRNPAGLYEALQLAPIPTEYEAASDGPWTGNPARLWTTSVKSQTESFADADAEAGVAKGVFQLRRDVDDMDNHDFKPNSNPGWELGLFNASSDCDTIDKSFINKKEMYPLVPMAEMLSGGFVQIQEYRDRLNPEDKFDHAMNFWGPGKFVVTGEPQDRPQPTFQLRGRWNNLEYPEGLGRIHGDQLNLHWMSRLKAETNTQIMRVFHRDTEKSVNLTLYSIQLAGDDLRPASIKETGGPKKGLFRLAPVKPAYNTKFWPNERLTKLDLGSMRFFNFYTTTSFDVDRDFVARDPEPVGFKISLREMTNSKGAKVNKTEYSLCYLIKSIKYEDWNLRPVTIVDDTDGLTTPDIIKPYQTQTGKDDRILIIRRLGTSGTGSNDREMDVEVRSYRRALIEKPREPGKPHPCLTVNVIKVKGPAKFTSPISASAGWQVLVDDVRNCGRPELVFLVGREHADYNVQVFGFNDDGKLVDRNIATPPALPATLPLSSYWNVYFGGHHFAALCPSETVPWTHDILQVSRFNHYGAATWADPYLYFRTWVKGDQPPADGGPDQWKKEPEMVERLWQGREDSVYYDESSPNPEQGLRKKYAVGASSAPVGWTTVVDAKLKDDLATARGYFSIKWRRCAVKIPKDPKLLGPDDPKVTTTRGIQEIFSYYGALGMRVFAPVKKGDYSAWQLVTQVPFLGQTSRGTGKTVGGNWNSVSILSYGAENEFGDINEWNRTYSEWKHFNDKDTWEKLEHGYGTKTAKGWEWKGRPYKPK